MKAHKYWSLGALATMIGTIYTGYKNMKSAHKYFACSSLLCMIMAIYSGHKMLSAKSRKADVSVIWAWMTPARKLKKGSSPTRTSRSASSTDPFL